MEVGGGVIFLTSGEIAGQHKSMPALAGQPSLHGYDACMVYWTKGALRRNCRQKHGETSFSPLRVFLISRNSRVRFWCIILWYLWIGRARHPGPPHPSRHVGLEVFNIGVWLTHGDLALEARGDFLAVVELRLIPARVRSEWPGLGRWGWPLRARIPPMLVMLELVLSV